MVLTETGLAKVFQRVKSFVVSQLNSKAPAIHTHTSSDITDLPNGYVVDSTLDGTSSNAIANSAVSNGLDGKSDTGHTHTVSDITDFPTLATVATSGSYNDLSDKPTIPTVNNATLKIQKNGSNVATFTANASSNVTANISVPTKVSQLTNDSGFITSVLPIGSYIQFAGSQAPAGFLVCNGGAISRTTYSKLFAVIGTKYGKGNGSTTFNLPNLTDRFLQGSTTSGTVKNAGLPDIIGSVSFHGAGTATNLQFADGSFRGVTAKGQYYGGTPTGGAISYDSFDFNASRSSSIYGNSTTVQPPALTCLICIKY